MWKLFRVNNVNKQTVNLQISILSNNDTPSWSFLDYFSSLTHFDDFQYRHGLSMGISTTCQNLTYRKSHYSNAVRKPFMMKNLRVVQNKEHKENFLLLDKKMDVFFFYDYIRIYIDLSFSLCVCVWIYNITCTNVYSV